MTPQNVAQHLAPADSGSAVRIEAIFAVVIESKQNSGKPAAAVEAIR